MVLHMVPGFASGAQIYSDVQVLRQVLGFYVRHQGLHQTLDSTSGTQVYIMRLVLPQTPRYVRHPLSMSSTRFYIRRAGLRQVTRCTSGAQFLRQAPSFYVRRLILVRRPGLRQVPSFMSDAQFLRHTAGFCIRRPHQVLVGLLHQTPCPVPRFTSGAQFFNAPGFYIRRPGLC